jgi:hypothetical protein
MEEVLKRDAILNYVREGLFARSLYLIVGVATASRVDVKESQSKGHNAHFSANAALPVAAVEGELSFSNETKRTTGAEFTIEKDVDFAYRVKEFEYSKWRKRFKDGHDMTKGALMGRQRGDIAGSDDDGDEGDDSVHGDEDYVPVFEGFEDEDVEGEDTEAFILSSDS